MFLHTILKHYEYLKVPYCYFPPDIVERYSLQDKVCDGYIYICVKKGMYGLRQAAVLAYETVKKLLKAADYQLICGSMNMWQHKH